MSSTVRVQLFVGKQTLGFLDKEHIEAIVEASKSGADGRVAIFQNMEKTVLQDGREFPRISLAFMPAKPRK